MLLVSGLAADLDLLSFLGGGSVYLRLHRTLLHSLAGSALLAVAVAMAFSRFGSGHQEQPVRFRQALVVCAIGAGGHLLLDLCNSAGVQLFWPFSGRWYAWDLLANLDPWVWILLLAGLLLPELFRLVSEEIGDRRKTRGPSRAAAVALTLLVLYVGGRAEAHSRAIDLLLSRDYHGAWPLAAGAFPSPTSPLNWRGVVATPNTLETVEVPFGPESEFDPDRSLTYFKPEPSPVLETAEQSGAARLYLTYARFPLANVDRVENGYRFTLRDLRFASDSRRLDTLVAVVDLDPHLRITLEKIVFAGASEP